MGIKKFFGWFKNRFSDSIYQIGKGQTISDLDENINIDNLMIDMNGVFHLSAQKIYQYGNFKPPQRLLGPQPKPPPTTLKNQMRFFEDVMENVDRILNMVAPKKRVILCVDGPAPLSKQNQQRQRRFMSSSVRGDNDTSFDSNSLTPGTKLMDYLTKYADWYIRKKMSDSNSYWSKVETVFSNEKAPGEGEHKLINYIRKYGNREESYCIHGMDADLIMLALGTHIRDFYILREDPKFFDYLIDVRLVRQTLSDMLIWNDERGKRVYNVKNAIDDFIFMCFVVGNDFLPHIPGIEIVEGGIDFMIDIYKKVGSVYGHITKETDEGIIIRRKAFKRFLGTLSLYEKNILETKLTRKDNYFPDAILEQNSKFDGEKFIVDIEGYREDYYNTNLPGIPLEKLCHDYLEGMQWVLTYYTQGIPNWKWRFPYHYAPFSATLAKNISTYKFKSYPHSSPTVPFTQLLSVLPPKSASLLPEPLSTFLKTGMPQYCPEKFDVDLSGKKHEFEGVVILPMVDYDFIEENYLDLLRKIDKRESVRNVLGKSFVYKITPATYTFRSYYGNFDCNVGATAIEL